MRAGATEAKIAEVATASTSDLFDERERAALEYAAARAAAALLTLDAGGNRPIELHLDSPGGALGAAFVLVDTADTLRSELRVLCRGQVVGPAIAVVAVADHRTDEIAGGR